MLNLRYNNNEINEEERMFLRAAAAADREMLAEIKTTFSYARISNERSVVFTERDPRFMSMWQGAFIQFGYIADDAPLVRGEQGWKIHVAVHYAEVVRAWDIVKNILIDEHIAQTKVVRPDTVFDDGEKGKQITIYQFVNPDRDWQHILQRIEVELRAAQILCGEFCHCDRLITGSLYLSYRNDGDESGRYYVSQKQALILARRLGQPAYNPYHKEDPLMVINVELEAAAGLSPV